MRYDRRLVDRIHDNGAVAVIGRVLEGLVRLLVVLELGVHEESRVDTALRAVRGSALLRRAAAAVRRQGLVLVGQGARESRLGRQRTGEVLRLPVAGDDEKDGDGQEDYDGHQSTDQNRHVGLVFLLGS